MNFAKISRTSFFIEHLWLLLLCIAGVWHHNFSGKHLSKELFALSRKLFALDDKRAHLFHDVVSTLHSTCFCSAGVNIVIQTYAVIPSIYIFINQCRIQSYFEAGLPVWDPKLKPPNAQKY